MIRSLIALLLVIAAIGAAEPPRAMNARWAWPLPAPHAIARPYVAPDTPYGRGHRGVDIRAPTGTEVRAPAAGVVHFAGFVVDRPVISIEHADGVLSSFEPVDAVVAAGERVRRGQVIGTLLAGHCAAPCLHLGARVRGEYVNPLLFLGGVPRAVLLPMGGERLRPWVRVRVGLLEALGGHVRVDLGRGEAGVAEQLLHGAQVGSAVE